MSVPEERMRILKMVESGQVTAEEGSRLLSVIGDETGRERNLPEQRLRALRVVVIDLNTRRAKVNVIIPANLVAVGLKLGARLIPRNSSTAMDEILAAVRNGTPGRIFEFHDFEESERIEIYVE
jgi:hypothetical protein